MANDSTPWFHEGLRFQCTMCGNCCTGAPGFVWINDEEIDAIAGFLHEPADQVFALYTKKFAGKRSLREKDNSDCIFYDRDAGCTIYPVRPRQCRTWPFWESNLRSPRAWQRTCETCPGSGTGELISPEEIVQRMKVIKL